MIKRENIMREDGSCLKISTKKLIKKMIDIEESIVDGAH